MEKIETTYSKVKEIKVSKELSTYYYIENDVGYIVFVVYLVGVYVFLGFIDKTTTNADKTDFETNIKPTAILVNSIEQAVSIEIESYSFPVRGSIPLFRLAQHEEETNARVIGIKFKTTVADNLGQSNVSISYDSPSKTTTVDFTINPTDYPNGIDILGVSGITKNATDEDKIDVTIEYPGIGTVGILAKDLWLVNGHNLPEEIGIYMTHKQLQGGLKIRFKYVAVDEIQKLVAVYLKSFV